MNSNSICPYCQIELKKIPKRKTKCINCGKDIFVRLKQSLFNRQLLKYDEAEVVDRLEVLLNYNILKNINKYNSKKNELIKKFEGEPKPFDILWGIYNELITSKINSFKLSLVQKQMAMIAEIEGKDPTPYYQLARKTDCEELKTKLIEFKNMGIKKAMISSIGDDDTCANCKQLDGKCFDIEKLIENMPIPLNCTSKNCRCTYIADI